MIARLPSASGKTTSNPASRKSLGASRRPRLILLDSDCSIGSRDGDRLAGAGAELGLGWAGLGWGWAGAGLGLGWGWGWGWVGAWGWCRRWAGAVLLLGMNGWALAHVGTDTACAGEVTLGIAAGAGAVFWGRSGGRWRCAA